jgi:hypothetical protein
MRGDVRREVMRGGGMRCVGQLLALPQPPCDEALANTLTLYRCAAAPTNSAGTSPQPNNGRAGTHCTDNRDDRYTAYTGDLSILPVFLLYARTHAPTDTPWFTITGTHTFTNNSGTRTLMSQHHLHHVDESTPTAPHCL